MKPVHKRHVSCKYECIFASVLSKYFIFMQMTLIFFQLSEVESKVFDVRTERMMRYYKGSADEFWIGGPRVLLVPLGLLYGYFLN